MAYTNGFPMTYPQMYSQPQYNYYPQQQINQPVAQQPQPVVQQPTSDNAILWVQGEAGAKSWAVAPGKSVMLMDSESNTFYIKASDQSGVPMPLRIFDYTERTAPTQVQPPVVQSHEFDTSRFVTKEELDRKLQELLEHKEEVKDNG